ncbi:MAG TPA: DUF4442 domain-containing protein [Thermoanaerobaculia bacterium]|nr:DUF4442 domain-containing protein [Thermoanaerobaculia bacterium]
MNLYPPFLGAGVRVRPLPGPQRAVEVTMRLRWWNRNYVGTHFGGSLYTMCDPFYMLLLLWELGPGWIVWDKAATIRFTRPGRTRVRAVFTVPAGLADEIRAAGAGGEKVEPVFEAEVTDAAGEVIARVEKVLYVRRKPAKAS